jgi:hypothetical protein
MISWLEAIEPARIARTAEFGTRIRLRLAPIGAGVEWTAERVMVRFE